MNYRQVTLLSMAAAMLFIAASVHLYAGGRKETMAVMTTDGGKTWSDFAGAAGKATMVTGPGGEIFQVCNGGSSGGDLFVMQTPGCCGYGFGGDSEEDVGAGEECESQASGDYVYFQQKPDACA